MNPGVVAVRFTVCGSLIGQQHYSWSRNFKARISSAGFVPHLSTKTSRDPSNAFTSKTENYSEEISAPP